LEQNRQILVVEPDDLILGLLQRWLGEAGYSVVVEFSEGLPQGAGARFEPDLVIIDVPMPRSAESLVKSVQETYAGPILLLSARLRRDTGSSSDVARQLGVRKVLPKPFTRGELLSAVGESIGA
jgi:DNA-binding response OmpR family regulator